MGRPDGPFSFSTIHATPPRSVRITDAARYGLGFDREFESRILHSTAHIIATVLGHATNALSPNIPRGLRPLRTIDALDRTTPAGRRLRKVESFLLCAVVTAAYGGACLIAALMRGPQRGSTVRALQGGSL